MFLTSKTCLTSKKGGVSVNELVSKSPFEKFMEDCKGNKKQSCVYVLLMSNNTVKIGRSKEFEKRKRTIETSSGLTVLKNYHTELLDFNDACEIENNCHRYYKDNKVKGEFFHIDFEEAKKRVLALLQLSYADKALFSVCEELADLAIKQEIEEAKKVGENITTEEAHRRITEWMSKA
jgi:hypothetical protein